MTVRVVPWILAMLGLAIPLVASGFSLWLLVALWLLGFAAVWLTGQMVSTTRGQRIAVALIALPALFLLAFEGGWWLIPADIAWLVVELTDRGDAGARGLSRAT